MPFRPPLCHVCKHPRVSWGLFVTPGTAAVTVCCLLQSVLALIKTSWPAATHHIYSHNDAHAQLRQSALIRWAKNMQTSMYLADVMKPHGLDLIESHLGCSSAALSIYAFCNKSTHKSRQDLTCIVHCCVFIACFSSFS